MTDFYDAAKKGALEQIILLVEQGVDVNQTGGKYEQTALSAAATNNHFAVVQYLVEQGADMEKDDMYGCTPLLYACDYNCFEVAVFLLEQGADRDKADDEGMTPLHCAAQGGHLETAKLLMVYGADFNARDSGGRLPIGMPGCTKSIKQAIRDEPRRRMDEAPGKRATEEDRHPNTASSASAQLEDEDDDEPNSTKPRLDEKAETEEGKVAAEDEDSEPSDEEDGN